MKGLQVRFGMGVQATTQGYWQALETEINEFLTKYPHLDVQDIKIVQGVAGYWKPMFIYKATAEDK